MKGLAETGVQRPQRLVEQQDPRLQYQGPGQSDALLLPSGKLVGTPTLQATELDQGQRPCDPRRHLIGRNLLEPQPEGHVAFHGEVGEKRVTLEDGVDRPVFRRQVSDLLAVDPHRTPVRPFEAPDYAQRCGLATSRRPEEGEELAGRYVEVDAPDYGHVVEPLLEVGEDHVARGDRHRRSVSARAVTN